MPKPYAINLPGTPGFEFLNQSWVVDLVDKTDGMLNCHVKTSDNYIHFNELEFDKKNVSLSKMQNLTKQLLLVKEHQPKSLKIGNSFFTNIEIITNWIIEDITIKPIECSIDEFDIVSCLLTINQREDGNTSLYKYLNYDEWQFEGSTSSSSNVQERIPTFHGQVKIDRHNKSIILYRIY